MVLNDLVERTEHSSLSTEQMVKLRTLVKGCQKALEDLDAMVDKYVKLSSGASGLRGKAQKISKKLDWNIKDVDSLRLRLISNTNMLEAFNSGITRYDSNFAMNCHDLTGFVHELSFFSKSFDAAFTIVYH